MEKNKTIQLQYIPSPDTLKRLKFTKRALLIGFFIIVIIPVFIADACGWGEGVSCPGLLYFINDSYFWPAFIISLIIIFICYLVFSKYFVLSELTYTLTDNYLEIKNINSHKTKKYNWDRFSSFSTNLNTFTKDVDPQTLTLSENISSPENNFIEKII